MLYDETRDDRFYSTDQCVMVELTVRVRFIIENIGVVELRKLGDYLFIDR